MVAQYASIKRQYNTSDFTVATTTGGNLTNSGTLQIAIVGHNRAGINIHSEFKTVNYNAGDSIEITLNSSIRGDAEDLHKVVILGKTTTNANATQLAEWQAKQSDQIYDNPLPATIILTEPDHILLDGVVATSDDFPIYDALIHGMCRQLLSDGRVYRYDTLVNDGDFPGSYGYWVVEHKGMYPRVTNTEDIFGCDRNLTDAITLIPPLPKTNTISTETFIWWRNSLTKGNGVVTLANKKLTLRMTLNGSTENGTNTYAELFNGLVETKFLGFVDIETGTYFDTVNVPAETQWETWYVTNTSIVFPADLPPGYAAAWAIRFNFDVADLPLILVPGDVFMWDVVAELQNSTIVPQGHIIGNSVLSVSDKLRVVPNKVLAGQLIAGDATVGYFQSPLIPETTNLIGLQLDTGNQAVVINAASSGVKITTDVNLRPTEVIRAFIGTLSGIGQLSSDVIAYLDNDRSLRVLIQHPVTGSERTQGIIRADYPDIIANSDKAEFIPPFLKIFVVNLQEDKIYQTIDAIPVMPAQETQEVIITSLSELEEINDYPDVPNDFDCFRPSIAQVNAIAGGNFTIGDYVVRAAYFYPSPNIYLTQITHDPALGCVREIGNTLIDVINNGPLYWKNPIPNLDILRSLPVSGVAAGECRLVTENGGIYWYDPNSIADDDSDIAIQLNDNSDAGRFIKIAAQGGGGGSGGGGSLLNSKGELLTHNGTDVTTLPLFSNNHALLTTDINTSTGLRWNTFSNIPFFADYFYQSGELYGQVLTMQYGGNISPLGAYAENLILASNLNRQAEWLPLSSVLPIGYSGAILIKNNTDEWITLPRGTVGQVLLINTQNLPSWGNLSLQSLSDSYGISFNPVNGDSLKFDAPRSKWRPRSDNNSFALNSLVDVAVSPNSDRLSLVWDAAAKTWVSDLPDLSLITGIEKITATENVTGDSNWGQTQYLISARKPFKDLKNNIILTNLNVDINTESPITGGLSYEFSLGKHSAISIPTNSFTTFAHTNLTLEFWFNTRSDVSSNFTSALFSRTDNTTETDFEIILTRFNSPAVLRFLGYNNAGNVVVGLATNNDLLELQANTWYHIAIVKNSTTWSLYLNGVLHETETVTGSLRSSFTSAVTMPLYIGNRARESNVPFNGFLEDIRFTTVARYNANFTPPDTYHPNQPIGNTKNSYSYSVKLQQLGDVDSTDIPQNGDVVQYDSIISKFKFVQLSGSAGGNGVSNLIDLADVDSTDVPQNGDVVQFNSSTNKFRFVPLPTPTIPVQSLTGLADVDSTNTPQDGDVPRYDAASGEFKFVALPSSGGGASNLVDLGDVDFSDTPQDGDVIQFDSGINKFKFVPLPTPTIPTLRNLTDVDSTDTPQNGDVVQFNNSTNKFRFVPLPTPTIPNLQDLTDVDSTDTPQHGNVVQYDSFTNKFKFNPLPVPTIPNLQDLTDVDFSDAPQNDDYIYYDSTVNKFRFGQLPVQTIPNLIDLSDIESVSPQDGQILRYDAASGEFKFFSLSSLGVPNLVELNDIDFTDTPQDGDVVQYDSAIAKFKFVAIPVPSLTGLADVDSTNTPQNGDVPQYNALVGKFEFVPMLGGAGGGADNLIDLNDVDASTLPANNDIIVYKADVNKFKFINPLKSNDLVLNQWLLS